VEARAKATQVNINPSDPAQFEQFAKAQSELGGALSRLLVTVEKYPEIRTNQNFLELQSQIEGTENRISVERMNFNKAVQEYNNAVLTFPGSLIAGFRNFQKRPFFQGDVAAQKAPTVDFGAPATLATPAPPAPPAVAATPAATIPAAATTTQPLAQ
jgi:LemA protein